MPKKPIDPRRRPSMTPRDMLPAGGVDWCYQTVELLKIRYERKTFTEQEWAKTLAELESHRAWEKIPPENPYGSEDEMLRAEIGVSKAQGTKAVRAAQKAVEQPRNGGDRRSQDARNQSDNITLKTDRGTGAQYLANRLKRDRPDLIERVIAGEFPSVRAAALEAGIVKRSITLPLDVDRAARLIVKHFSPEDVQRLCKSLASSESLPSLTPSQPDVIDQ